MVKTYTNILMNRWLMLIASIISSTNWTNIGQVWVPKKPTASTTNQLQVQVSRVNAEFCAIYIVQPLTDENHA